MPNFYRWILAAHPRAFRERFETEMLCVFEEALATESTFRLMMDGVISLLRQRLFRRLPARKVFQAAPAGPNNLFSSFLGEQHPIPMKMSRLIFGAAISFNLLVMTCTLIGRGYALDSGKNRQGAKGHFRSSGRRYAAATLFFCEAEARCSRSFVSFRTAPRWMPPRWNRAAILTGG
jgi:hypothetical protein